MANQQQINENEINFTHITNIQLYEHQLHIFHRAGEPANFLAAPASAPDFFFKRLRLLIFSQNNCFFNHKNLLFHLKKSNLSTISLCFLSSRRAEESAIF